VTDNPPTPGHDQITVTTPAARSMCNTREHTRLGVLADVVVTFGTLGTAACNNDALRPETWGRSYPMCAECWEATRQVAQRHRPGLVITGAQP